MLRVIESYLRPPVRVASGGVPAGGAEVRLRASARVHGGDGGVQSLRARVAVHCVRAEDVIGIGVDVIGTGVDGIGIGADVIGIRMDVIGITVDVIGIIVDVIGIAVDVIDIIVDVIGISVDVIRIGVRARHRERLPPAYEKRIPPESGC